MPVKPMPVYSLPSFGEMFPSPFEAEPDGLLAVGGTLSSERLVAAYAQGIFPWYQGDQPILWWSPDPRCILLPENFHVPRSLRKLLRQEKFSVTMDTAFSRVINGCAQPRPYAEGTWLVPDMIAAFEGLHELGIAHSVEAWRGGALVGGVYGVALGRIFFGESMFYREPGASKVAFVHLAEALWAAGYHFIDCQQETANLLRFGARGVPRAAFMKRLAAGVAVRVPAGLWNHGMC